MQTVDFEKILELFESNGWVLKELWGNYRAFIDPDDGESLPYLIPVNDKKVNIEYYHKILRFFENENEGT